MISTLANAQNRALRRQFEDQGFKFSVGADGWAVYCDDEIVAEAISRRKGEGVYEDNLDQAVFAAGRHQKRKEARVAEQNAAQNAAPPAPEAPSKKPSLQSKAVKAAIQFLIQSGAQYRVEFEGEVFTNVPEKAVKPPKPEKIDYGVHWRPVLEQFKEQGSFSTTLAVPEEYDFKGYTASVRMYLMRAYGPGNTMSSLDAEKRTMEIMVAKVEE